MHILKSFLLQFQMNCINLEGNRSSLTNLIIIRFIIPVWNYNNVRNWKTSFDQKAKFCLFLYLRSKLNLKQKGKTPVFSNCHQMAFLRNFLPLVQVEKNLQQKKFFIFTSDSSFLRRLSKLRKAD